MKKVAIFIPNLKMGGAQKSLVSLLNELDLNQLHVSLYLLQKENDLLEQVPSEIKVHYLDNYYDVLKNQFSTKLKKDIIIALCKGKVRYTIRKIRHTLKYLKFSRTGLHEEQKIWSLVKNSSESVDIVADYCVSFMQGSMTYYLIDKVSTNAKKIEVLNTDYKKAGYSSDFDKYYFDQLDNIVCLSDEVANVLKKAHPSLLRKVVICENIVSPKEIYKFASLQCDYAIPKDMLTICSCGRLAIQVKGYDLIIEAARQLKQSGIKFRWIIIGDGDGRKWMEQKISEYRLENQVILLGTILNPYPVINQCDIFVHASRFEGRTRAIREAKVLKKAIVATNFDTVSADLTNEYDGLIVPMCGKDICDAIVRLANDHDLAIKLINNISISDCTGVEKYHNMFGIL